MTANRRSWRVGRSREQLSWAARLHRGQRRAVDDAPFILHPVEVAALLSGRGCDEEVVVAGLLHDAVENTVAEVDDVRERFGDRVARIVAAVTEDPAIGDYATRKAALREQVAVAGRDAQAVFAADKLDQDLRAAGAGGQESTRAGGSGAAPSPRAL